MDTYKLIIKDLFLDVFLEIGYFPAWWYTKGLKKTLFFCLKKIKAGWKASGLWIILANFFTPMYAQRGWDAYLLTTVTRLLQILAFGSLFLIWTALWIIAFFAWMILPPLALIKLFL